MQQTFPHDPIVASGSDSNIAGLDCRHQTVGIHRSIVRVRGAPGTVPAYTMVVGNPAKFYSYVCRCGVKLDKNLTCPACGAKYKKTGENSIQPE